PECAGARRGRSGHSGEQGQYASSGDYVTASAAAAASFSVIFSITASRAPLKESRLLTTNSRDRRRAEDFDATGLRVTARRLFSMPQFLRRRYRATCSAPRSCAGPEAVRA